jgi:hypothetical protein
MRRISRPCYNKSHRCPGWAGGGIHRAKVDRCPSGGYINAYGERAWKWRFHTCQICDVLVLPYMVRWIDPAYIWHWKIKDFPRWLDDRIWEWRHRR